MNRPIFDVWNTYTVQKLVRRLRPRLGVRPDWSLLAMDPAWILARQESLSGYKVLIATSTGSNWPCSALESMLGIALTLRGANVRFLLCDGILPACQECDHQWLSESRFVRQGPQSGVCAGCFSPAWQMLNPLGLPILRYSQFLKNSDANLPIAASITRYLSEHAEAGALRYFGRGTLSQDDTTSAILERYKRAAEMVARVMAQLLAQETPDVTVFHHGIYVPQGVVGAVLRDAGLRVVNWIPTYRNSTALFSHGDSHHHTLIDEELSQWSDIPWSEKRESEVMKYLGSRRTGANDWIGFQRHPGQASRAIISSLELDSSLPVIGLLTNVIWDAQLHFRETAFSSMLDWLFSSIRYFSQRSELQLVIRIHPAEIFGSVPSRQLVADEISKRFSSLPAHIKIVGPADRTSTYSLMNLCNGALVYGTKTALELACTGLPVVVAGEAWTRDKGFTIDVSSQKEYFEVLDTLPFKSRLTEKQKTAARKYAYHLFFRRMIPLKGLKPKRRFAPFQVKVSSINELRPGFDPGLDTVCDGILTGSPFVYNS